MGQEEGEGIKDNSDFELGGPDARAEEEEVEKGGALSFPRIESNILTSASCACPRAQCTCGKVL